MKGIIATAGLGILACVLLLLSVRTLQVENAELRAKIALHNSATEKLADAGKLDSSEAAGRVAEVLIKAQRDVQTLPKGTGPKAMNEFMGAVFK